jgi:flagellar hook-associated protein 1 FlgK
MADMLSTAVSALQAYRRGLDTTSHNVANVSTEGYSRQRIDMSTREAQQYGNGFVGSGVNVTSVKRVYDDFVALQYRSTTTSLEQQDVYAALAERVNNLYADTSTGLSATLQKFANALQGVANSPSSMAARQVMMSEANALAAQIGDYGSRLEQLANEVNQRMVSATGEVNSLATAIADLNEKIVIATGRSGGQPPNDLLDQRDLLIDELSARIAVSTIPQDDGSLNVFVGTGQPLVLGTQAAELVTQADPFDASRVQVAVKTPAGPVDITNSLTGGELGGMLEFRSSMLDPARNALGQLAVGVASLVNEHQAMGMDLEGRIGIPLFAVGDVGVLPNLRNGGTATVNATRSDATVLTTANYLLERTAGAWTLRRTDTGTNVAMTGTGTAADPLVADGLAFVVSGSPVSGDQFLIRPTQDAAVGMGVLFTDPSRLAAALPVVASISASNTGSAKPGAMGITDPADANLRATATISFTSATTYTINGGAAQAYTPGQPIQFNGWSLQLDGTPADGDSFTVGNNASGVGDNRNFLTLGSALSRPYLDGGTTSINAALGRAVADIGVKTHQSQIARDALAIVQRDAISSRDSVSGVNLDEEAANLIRYQQAYQAAAQVVQVANSIFDSLLGAIRR